MNIGSIKNRLKKLEPKQVAERWFGELHTNDPHIFHDKDHRYAGSWRIFGRVHGTPCVFDGGYFDTFDEGMDKLKTAFRRRTIALCDIFHLETIDGKLELHTVYELDGLTLRDKYPQGLNEPTPDMLSGDTSFAKMSDIEVVAFFNDVP